MKERRQHARFPLAHDMGELVSIDFVTPSGKYHDEAVIIDLSAGGLGMLTAAELSLGAEFDLSIKLPSLKSSAIKCEVVWVLEKQDINKVGIKFKKINKNDMEHLNKIAQDHTDCETKLLLGVKDVCFKKCHYFALCKKNAKV